MVDAHKTANADKVKTIEGDPAAMRPNAESQRVRIVASRYNREITDALLEGALDVLFEHGVKEHCIELVRVPGAFEIPLALAQVGGTPIRWDAQLALGCVIRGETAHFDLITEQCSRGVMDVMVKTGVPIAFEVLSVESREQAEARAGMGGSTSHRGRAAAFAALEMADLIQKIRRHD